jgi:hypothetical protein
LDKAPEKDLVDLAGILGNFKLTLYRKWSKKFNDFKVNFVQISCGYYVILV